MKEKIKWSIVLLSILLLLPVMAMADEELIMPEYTEEYKEWLELTEEERANTIEPQAYKLSTENEISIASEDEANEIWVEASSLPSQYQRKYYGSVKDQGSTNACWAYSAASMFDVNYYLTNNLTKRVFSNLHMDYMTSYRYNSNGFYRAVDSGGNFQIALAYATNGMGIALESDMSSLASITSSTLSTVDTVSKVDDYIEVSGESEIKSYIYKYGVLPVYTYISGTSYFSSSSLYNNSDLAYCCTNYNMILKANHAVTLIGWDDNYTNDSFSGKTGAYIALNSWGSTFGNGGLYYIFYDDIFASNITNYGVTEMSDIDYDYLYQYDTYGWTAECGYWEGTYAANVFTREEDEYSEILTEVSSYFPDAGQVTIYINSTGSDVAISSADYTYTTTISAPGYYTIELPQSVTLQSEKFVVGIYYPGAMSGEIPTSSGWCSTATSNAGESYISSDGVTYYEMQDAYSSYTYANACIKAFTEKGSLIAYTPVYGDNSDLANYVFDYKYYADHNPDLYVAFGYDESALYNHWVTYGIAEGRASSCILNLQYYASQNSDLAAAFGYDYTALYQHFMNYGYGEYRKSSLEYDGTYYKRNNTDLKSMTAMQLIRHYATYGENEMRRASETYDITEYLFDAEIYAACNPDVVAALGSSESALKLHWYAYGISEGRIASLIFDAQYYLNNYSDLKNAFSTNYTAAYEHFISYGFSESRQGSAVFSVSYYLSNNSDLKTAFGSNYKMAVNHFVTYGASEGRKTSSVFYVKTYRSKNADLKAAFGTNYKSYFIHYLQYGKNEGRTCV